MTSGTSLGLRENRYAANLFSLPPIHQHEEVEELRRGRTAAVLWSALALLLAIPLLIAPIAGWLYLTGHTP